MVNRSPANADAVNGGGAGRPVVRLAAAAKANAHQASTLAARRGLRSSYTFARVVAQSALRRVRGLPAAPATARATATAGLLRVTPMPVAAVQARALSASTLGVRRTLLALPASAEALQVSAIDVDPVIEVFPPGQYQARAIATTGPLSLVATLAPVHAFAAASGTAELIVSRSLQPRPAVARAEAKAGELMRVIELPRSSVIAQANAYGGTPVAIVTEKEPPYRTVTVNNDAATQRPRTFQRQPGDFLPYDIDMEQWLAPFPGDGIESVVVNVTEANGLGADVGDLDVSRIDFVVPAIQDPALPAIRAKVWVQGGISGALYKVTVRCTTIGDRVKEADFRLSVNEV